MDQEIEYIWVLMARKLSGEASEDELAALQQLLIQNPQETYSLEIMQDIWKNKPATDPRFSESSYKELSIRMQQLGIDSEKFTDEDHIVIKSEEPKSKNSKKKYLLSALFSFFKKTTLKRVIGRNDKQRGCY
jgi:hypothetical protein